jgi:hypothetical protein
MAFWNSLQTFGTVYVVHFYGFGIMHQKKLATLAQTATPP